MNGNSAIHTMPIQELVTWILNHNRIQSELFCSPDARGDRRQYRAQHPTEILAFKCMDGRLALAPMTGIPFGILQPFRNLGGIFDLGWPYFERVVEDDIDFAIAHGRDCIILVTYHWSKGDAHRGCRGFHYNVEAARAHALTLVGQCERIFGEGHSTVYPVCIGVETDEDAMTFHGQRGESLDLGTIEDRSESALRNALERLYPDMKARMIHDLLPLLIGNVAHVAAVRKEPREVLHTEHRERILGIGRGFDWLHLRNIALVVGPFDPNLDQAIETAMTLLRDNIERGHVPDDGLILLTSAPYSDAAGYDRRGAMEKAGFLTRFALEVIRHRMPTLRERIISLTGIVNINTRRLEITTP